MHVVIFHNAVSPDDSAADRDVLVQADMVGRALSELGHSWATVACTLDLGAARDQLSALRPDVVFNLVESLGASDWLASAATGLLDTMGIPYTGSPTEALLLTNHKVLAKQRLCQAGLPTPEWLGPVPGRAGGSTLGLPGRASDSLRKTSEVSKTSEVCWVAGAAYVIKIVWEHASFNLDERSIVRPADEAGLRAVLRESACRLRRPCFAERYVEGREFNLSVLAGAEGAEVLPPAEIDFSAFPPGKPRIVGQRAKWEEASFEFQKTPHRFDFPPSDRSLLDRLFGQARQAWHLFGLGGYARVDSRVDDAGEPWILEINANPCLSPDAGFAAALAQASISFPQAVARILEDASR